MTLSWLINATKEGSVALIKPPIDVLYELLGPTLCPAPSQENSTCRPASVSEVRLCVIAALYPSTSKFGSFVTDKKGKMGHSTRELLAGHPTMYRLSNDQDIDCEIPVSK